MSTPILIPKPVEMYGFEGNNPQHAALKFQASQNNTQSNLNNVARGGKSHKRKSYKRKSHKRKSHKRKHRGTRHRHRGTRHRGGNGNIGLPKTVVVPQFAILGPPVSPVNANSSSIVGNTAAIHGLNNATNDCYATNSCGKVGGKRKSRKQKK